MSAWARPGVKCVFVGIPAGKKPDWRGISPLADMETYTIREVIDHATGPQLRLVEVINPPVQTRDWGLAERTYPLVCFRPLITRTQEEDLALFVHHLDRVPSGLETVDIAFLRAWAQEGIIPFEDYAAELTARGLA